MLVVRAACFMFQEPETKSVARPIPNGTSPAMVTATSARAVLAPRTPAIDGRDDDEVWRLAAPITEFLEFDPNEGKAPRFRTEARVAYDARNFYVFVRAFDDEPERVLKLL